MTVAVEEPGILVAVCDGCHAREVLPLDPDVDVDQIADAFEELGWAHLPPIKDTQTDGMGHTVKVVYAQDFCAICQAPEAAPKPKFGRARPTPRQHVEACDPCDEWPRALIFAAVGLRPDCGHPPNPDPKCSWCTAGYPIGTTRSMWRR